MRRFVFFYFLFACINSYAQNINLKIFSEKTDKGYIMYATNGEHGPVSIQLDLKLENLNATTTADKLLVIPPQSRKFRLLELNIGDERKKFGYSFRYKSVL